MYPPSLKKLIGLFSKFPTVGPRSATRFAFYLTKLSPEEIEELSNSIKEIKKRVKVCPQCFNIYEGEKELCEICSQENRDRGLLCVVANEIDLMAIEKTQKYRGLYFVLGGTISKLAKEKIKKLRIKELERRIQTESRIKEIILAFNPTLEGETTTLYLKRRLAGFGKKITQLGRGLPTGGELEYADEETLSSALESRK